MPSVAATRNKEVPLKQSWQRNSTGRSAGTRCAKNGSSWPRTGRIGPGAARSREKFVFKHLEIEARVSREYLAENGRTLFGDIIGAERTNGSRILYENDTAIAFLPDFARCASEVYVAPKAPHGSLADLSHAEIDGLALALKDVLVRFNILWQMPFPYVLVLHQAPSDGSDISGFHFHMDFHPPLRKPDQLKYLAGPEIGGGNPVHYKTR